MKLVFKNVSEKYVVVVFCFQKKIVSNQNNLHSRFHSKKPHENGKLFRSLFTIFLILKVKIAVTGSLM